MKLNFLGLFLALASFLAAAIFVDAVALKVTPSELRVEIGVGELLKKEIAVENPGSDVALYEIYLDDFSQWVRINPASFILESREIKRAGLEINSKEAGVFSTNVSVVAKSLLETKFKANSGVKIPLAIRVSEKAPGVLPADIASFLEEEISMKFFIFALGAFAILLITLVLFFRKKMVE